MKKKHIKLSKILGWYQEDFGKNKDEVTVQQLKFMINISPLFSICIKKITNIFSVCFVIDVRNSLFLSVHTGDRLYFKF
jgi:hypothetical protein